MSCSLKALSLRKKCSVGLISGLLVDAVLAAEQRGREMEGGKA